MHKLISFGWSGLLLVIFFLFSLAVFFYPPLQNTGREFFAPAERKILSVATGNVLPDGLARVIKILTPQYIAIEVYGPLSDSSLPLIDKIIIADKQDAQFQFQARATNLALKDMDNDGIFEIIAPSYDASLAPHLNIYRYNVELKKFEPYLE